MKIVVVFPVAQLVTTVTFFSAWDKSVIKLDNSQKTEDSNFDLKYTNVYYFTIAYYAKDFLGFSSPVWLIEAVHKYM